MKKLWNKPTATLVSAADLTAHIKAAAWSGCMYFFTR